MTTDPKILITGATSGLGREMAIQLATRGEYILATGRREDRLTALEAHARITGTALDQTSEADIAKFCAEAGPLSGIILNAGITFTKPFSDGDFETDMALIQTNVISNLQIIRSLLPTLKETQGRILPFPINLSMPGRKPLWSISACLCAKS